MATAAANASIGEFASAAIRRAVREAEYARIREAYLVKPDAEAEADEWRTAEAYKPWGSAPWPPRGSPAATVPGGSD